MLAIPLCSSSCKLNRCRLMKLWVLMQSSKNGISSQVRPLMNASQFKPSPEQFLKSERLHLLLQCAHPGVHRYGRSRCWDHPLMQCNFLVAPQRGHRPTPRREKKTVVHQPFFCFSALLVSPTVFLKTSTSERLLESLRSLRVRKAPIQLFLNY